MLIALVTLLNIINFQNIILSLLFWMIYTHSTYEPFLFESWLTDSDQIPLK